MARSYNKYDDLDIDKLLNDEATEINREKEMFRVLSAFKLNPYEILDIQLTTVTDQDAVNSLVKKAYRTKSLMLHPDKLKHVRGPEAFDMIKKVMWRWISLQPPLLMSDLYAHHRPKLSCRMRRNERI